MDSSSFVDFNVCCVYVSFNFIMYSKTLEYIFNTKIGKFFNTYK